MEKTKKIFFQKAKPIWLTGLQKEKNIQALFKTEFVLEKGKQARVIITAATFYRICVNNHFAGYGPARAPHGYVRVDGIDITDKLQEGMNTVSIEAAGYYCASFYTIRQPSFLQAEIISENQVLAYTGRDFKAELQRSRIQKVMRNSWQRAFSEVWDMSRSNIPYETETVDCPGKYLERGVRYPVYKIHSDYKLLEQGDFHREESELRKDRYITQISRTFDGFMEEELEAAPLYIWQSLIIADNESGNSGNNGILKSGRYVLLDMGRNYTGFIMLKLKAVKDSHIMLCFDEKLVDGTISFKNMEMINLLDYKMKDQEDPWKLESFEVYGFRYAMLYVLEGEIELQGFCVRTYEYPMDILPYKGNDESLKMIYDAAARTLCQNSLDIYMDCPTRERAGWLCDSYFTAQAEYEMTGKVEIEPVFMENYRLYPQGTIVPEGMLPMCYPADHLNGEFIPQWAMWYILELEQYLQRDSNAGREDFRSLCYNLLKFFKQYENEDGLLERLPSWNFVEWSKANEWVQDVNYPTNMLYAGIQAVIGDIYDDDELKNHSERLKETIIKEAFNGQFFMDHAVRDEQGHLIRKNDISEVCQYYAIKFLKIDIRNDKIYSRLKKAVLDEFGPNRGKTGELADIEPANALMGIYIRMELLLEMNEKEKLKYEIKEYFGAMAAKTGTLWEHRFMASSLNHGFASFAGAVIRRIEQESL